MDLPNHRGRAAVQRLLEHAPGTGSLALWMQHRDVPADVDARGPWYAPVPLPSPVITDGRTLHYTRAFDALDLDLQTGWVAHAVLHVALRHVPRLRALRRTLGDVDAVLYNRCADAIVNTTLDPLRWLALPADALRLERLLAEVLGVSVDPVQALAEWDVERLYRAVDDRRAAGPRARRGADRPDPDGEGDGGRQPDGRGRAAGEPEDADPADAPAPAVDGWRAARLRQLATDIPRDLAVMPDADDPPEAEADQAREWLERLRRGHAADGAFSLLRTLPADARLPDTRWEDVLRLAAARALAPQATPSWSRPSRAWLAVRGRSAGGARLPWEPGTSATRAVPRLVLVVDVSGSVDDATLARFRRELEALRRRHDAALTVVLGDDAVRAVRHHEPSRGSARWAELLAPVQGGGGTDFAPLLEEAQRHRPDLVVVLTDLDGPAGYRPAAPVVWAVPDDAPAGTPPPVAPFGRLLRLR